MIQEYSLDDIWYETVRDILSRGKEVGSRDGKSIELLGYYAILNDPTQNVIFNPGRKFSLIYACAEMLWYLSKTDDIAMIQAYAPQYERFANDGKAFGAYGKRWVDTLGAGHQLDWLLDTLKIKSLSRQAVMSMWRGDDLLHGHYGHYNDIPCTLTLQFLLRDKLYLICNMRSNDAWLGLPYDVFCFTTLQRLVAEELSVPLGAYIHQAGSEHLYIRNVDKASDCQMHAPKRFSVNNYGPFSTDLWHDIGSALRIEEHLRKRCGTVDEWSQDVLLFRSQHVIERPLIRDLVYGVARKWGYNLPFDNPVFQELVNAQT